MVRQTHQQYDLGLERDKSRHRATLQSRPSGAAQWDGSSGGQADQVVSLFSAQHALGNQAVQRILAQGTLTLGKETLVHIGRSSDALARAIARTTAREAHLRLGAKNVAIQREGDETGEQAQADTGTVTIGDVIPDYYDVTGSTLADVYSQLDPEEWGRCHYQYDYSYDSANGRATRVNITLTLTIRLPRWQGEGWDNASPAAQAEWRRMLDALQAHEQGHAAIARRWAPTFQERLLGQRESRIQQRFDQTLKNAKKEQKQFDQRTRHGQTQGVSLDTSIQ